MTYIPKVGDRVRQPHWPLNVYFDVRFVDVDFYQMAGTTSHNDTSLVVMWIIDDGPWELFEYVPQPGDESHPQTF